MRRRRRRKAAAAAGCCPRNQEKRKALFSVLFQGFCLVFFCLWSSAGRRIGSLCEFCVLSVLFLFLPLLGCLFYRKMKIGEQVLLLL
ncbi:hypothetical protein LINPERPRIM_LOCUS33010 [Linum perenne]